MPDKCPVCGSPVEKMAGEVALRCSSFACPAQQLERIVHFASKGAMDIEGLGPAIVEKLLNNKIIKDAADIYYVKYDQVLGLENFKEKSANNLLSSIQASKSRPLSRLLFALGIRFVGSHIADVLAANYADLNSLMSAGFDQLSSIFEIGPRIAESIVTFFSVGQNRDIIEKLKSAGVNFESAKLDSRGPSRIFRQDFCTYRQAYPIYPGCCKPADRKIRRPRYIKCQPQHRHGACRGGRRQQA